MPGTPSPRAAAPARFTPLPDAGRETPQGEFLDGYRIGGRAPWKGSRTPASGPEGLPARGAPSPMPRGPRGPSPISTLQPPDMEALPDDITTWNPKPKTLPKVSDIASKAAQDAHSRPDSDAGSPLPPPAPSPMGAPAALVLPPGAHQVRNDDEDGGALSPQMVIAPELLPGGGGPRQEPDPFSPISPGAYNPYKQLMEATPTAENPAPAMVDGRAMRRNDSTYEPNMGKVASPSLLEMTDRPPRPRSRLSAAEDQLEEDERAEKLKRRTPVAKSATGVPRSSTVPVESDRAIHDLMRERSMTRGQKAQVGRELQKPLSRSTVTPRTPKSIRSGRGSSRGFKSFQSGGGGNEPEEDDDDTPRPGEKPRKGRYLSIEAHTPEPTIVVEWSTAHDVEAEVDIMRDHSIAGPNWRRDLIRDKGAAAEKRKTRLIKDDAKYTDANLDQMFKGVPQSEAEQRKEAIKVLMRRITVQWKQQYFDMWLEAVEEVKRIRRIARVALSRWTNAELAGAFRTWRFKAESARHRRVKYERYYTLVGRAMEVPRRMMFYKAVRNGDLRAAKDFVRQRGEKMVLGMVDGGGRSALHEAARTLQPVMCTYLLRTGADPHLKDYGGCTPIDLAADREGRADPERVMKVMDILAANSGAMMLPRIGLTSLLTGGGRT